MKRTFKEWGMIIIAFIFMVVLNGLANALPINGQNTGEISDKYSGMFTPAGFTFSIWGLIYFFLAIFVVYQALKFNRENKIIAPVDTFIIINFIANGLWIILWHYDLVLLSFLLMLVILSTLIAIYIRVQPYKKQASPAEIICLHIPFSLYFSWIVVASLANFSVLQQAYSFDSFILNPTQWAIAKIAAAGTIGAVMVMRRNDVVFQLVVGWAAFGIYSNQAESSLFVAGAAAAVSIVAVSMAAYELYLHIVVRVKRISENRRKSA